MLRKLLEFRNATCYILLDLVDGDRQSSSSIDEVAGPEVVPVLASDIAEVVCLSAGIDPEGAVSLVALALCSSWCHRSARILDRKRFTGILRKATERRGIDAASRNSSSVIASDAELSCAIRTRSRRRRFLEKLR